MLTLIPPGHRPIIPDDWVWFEFVMFTKNIDFDRIAILKDIVAILEEHEHEGFYHRIERTQSVDVGSFASDREPYVVAISIGYVQIAVDPDMFMILKLTSEYSNSIKQTEPVWVD